MEHLTEPGMKAYFLESFEKCKEYKMNYYTKLVNIGLFILFVAILAGILYMKKKEKMIRYSCNHDINNHNKIPQNQFFHRDKKLIVPSKQIPF